MVRLPLICALVALPTVARAQPRAPKFDFGKAPEKPAAWKAAAKGGLLASSGNSRSVSFSVSLTASCETEKSKVSFEGQAAYGHSNILIAVADPTTGDVVALQRQSQVTTNQWRLKGRYDRFLTVNNAAYLAAGVGADRIAGKSLFGGGQVGYSRQLVKDEVHTVAAEIGYDAAFETYVDPSLDTVAIHSARVFLGEQAKLTAATAVNVSAEALFNLNQEHAPDAADVTRDHVAAFHDTRVIGKAGITTTLWKKLSFGFGVTVAYDQNPAPRPVPKAPTSTGKYAADFHPFADRVDTLTEATLVFTFL
jgi:hypothetical protein